MNIRIYPSDIVEYCLWDKFVYYVLNSDSKKAERMLKDDIEFDITEQDAYIIGLTRVVKTTNLIHKFNIYIIECLTNKFIKDGDKILYIKKKLLESIIDTFISKFPIYWESKNVLWDNSIKECFNYIEKFKKDLLKLDIHIINDKNNDIEYYNVAQIKKLLKFNY